MGQLCHVLGEKRKLQNVIDRNLNSGFIKKTITGHSLIKYALHML
jgi:hypothetical protein